MKKLDTYGLVHRFWFLRYKALLSNPLDTLSSVLKCWKCRIILHFFASELVYWSSTHLRPPLHRQKWEMGNRESEIRNVSDKELNAIIHYLFVLNPIHQRESEIGNRERLSETFPTLSETFLSRIEI